ncbi:MAG TPA: hypothetical protein VK947_02115, partial [Planococcus sp. (in: firmicutes)]|nr:hypothetical protein [Planococcus sp. (in: firmicutes)]
LGLILIEAELVTLMIHMNGKAKKGLHGSGPKGLRIQLHHRLQIAQLVCQAELEQLGVGFQLGGQGAKPASSLDVL